MIHRIVVVGAGAVGKSALTVRFIKGTFISAYDPTIEDSYRKQVEVDGKHCIVDIMDTAGQEEYSSLRDQYLKLGDGFVLGYSITSLNSLEAAAKLKNTICRVKEDLLDIPMVLCGNKCDLEAERVVSVEEGKKTAENLKIGFMESSAKANKNVNQLFFEVVRLIDKWRERYPAVAPPGTKEKKRFCVLL